MKIYISGQITGLPEEEYKANFEAARMEAIMLGHEVVCPTQLPHKHNRSWQDYLNEDLAALRQCQGIYMQRNWLHSQGAIIELKEAIGLKLEIVWQAN